MTKEFFWSYDKFHVQHDLWPTGKFGKYPNSSNTQQTFLISPIESYWRISSKNFILVKSEEFKTQPIYQHLMDTSTSICCFEKLLGGLHLVCWLVDRKVWRISDPDDNKIIPPSCFKRLALLWLHQLYFEAQTHHMLLYWRGGKSHEIYL